MRRVFVTYSSSVYGNEAGLVNREDVLGSALSPHLVSERAVGCFIGVLAARFGLETIVLRYLNLFRLWNDPDPVSASVVPLHVDAGSSEGSSVVFGSGERQSFTDAARLRAWSDRVPEAPLEDGLERSLPNHRRHALGLNQRT